MTNEVIDHLAHLTIRYMYNDKVSKSLGEAKALKWGQMKKKSTSRIPPDMDSFQLYVARVNYQTYLHLGFVTDC